MYKPYDVVDREEASLMKWNEADEVGLLNGR